MLVAVLLLLLVGAVPARADVWRDRQWYFAPMKLAQAQKLGRGGAGVTVAVLDTGIDNRHPDLRGAIVSGRHSNVITGPHGTAMAALIAGRGHGDGDGVLGVAPRSRVIPIRPVRNHALAVEGIDWAITHGAKVINMSFELKSDGSLQRALARAAAADVVLVAAAGNESGAVSPPARYPGVIAVGSVGRDNKVTSFSNHGPELDVVAYGVDIPVVRPGGKYAVTNGTSVSSAIVAGAAALIRARFPDMPAAEVVDRITGTAKDRGPRGHDDRYGSGQLDVMAALTEKRAPRKAASVKQAAQKTQQETTTAVGTPTIDSRPRPLLIVVAGSLLLGAGLLLLGLLRWRRNS
ncbi:S8 family serine peptidase [Actinoplanes sp. NPDC049596]|uniref:S8 family serine peptidase n=1 Tax=unclassified Actinoplanes TaxID=2626549 RepID=UPI00344097D9